MKLTSLLYFQLLFLAAFTLMPMPKKFEKGDKTVKILQRCAIRFSSQQEFPDHVLQLLRHYHELMTLNSNCQFDESIKKQNLQVEGSLKLNINLQSDEQLYWVNDTKQEAYTVEIDEKLNVNINAPNHWALARAIDTVNQLTENNEVENLPLKIYDEPAYVYRGVMVDTARHFLPLKILERTVDALVINKMNVLHWHITDDESFPLLLTNYSQITNTSKHWDTAYFTKSDVSYIIEYASIRGVQIIPEIDSPAHAQSWGRSPELAEMVITCGSTIKQYGQFDPTMELTYEVLKSVMQDFNDMFAKVQFIHFGGDEASNSCFDQRPSIKQFMNEHGIATYFDLQVYYRQRQKDIWKNVVKSSKRVAYWYNKQDQLPAEDDDIIHWWGLTSQLVDVKNRKNDFILSDYHPLYLDVGVGNAFGNSYDAYQTWKDVYKWSPVPPEGFQGNILGGEAPLWGETNNQNTHFQKMFLRSSILGDTLWNPNSKSTEQFWQFTQRLSEMEDRMNKYGFPVSPFTHDYCKRHTKLCFPTLYQDEQNSQDAPESLVQEQPNIILQSQKSE
ncbi:unnamed protein product [Paramecium octaurelia]|uniref:Beta-hexosaminidase n=1 Tax=Paramecium octaurelia TaxID=43137 RepID=A0A8S1S3P7_PAROT|nr:unnamed protein product [Paramecium octaurelia]